MFLNAASCRPPHLLHNFHHLFSFFIQLQSGYSTPLELPLRMRITVLGYRGPDCGKARIQGRPG